jgi:hypothetical protein
MWPYQPQVHTPIRRAFTIRPHLVFLFAFKFQGTHDLIKVQFIKEF